MDSTPRAYRLKASNAYLTFSTAVGTSPVEGPRSQSGRLLGVEADTIVLPDGGGVATRHRVTLMTDSGLSQFILEDADSIRFLDPGLDDQVTDALAAIADHRVRDVRTLEVETTGEGVRRIRVGYVVEAPLWKTSYRLVLPAGTDAAAGLLQGWAVVENLSGGDWDGVELTLVSGNPVTFRQAIYTAYYVDRPEVPVEVLGRVLPRPDHGALRSAGVASSDFGMRKAEEGMSDMVAAPSMLAELAGDAVSVQQLAYAEAPSMAPAQMIAAQSEEAATQVMFRVPYAVSLESGRSLMVPIINGEVPLRRLAHYQPDIHASHPLASIDLINDSGSGLPPGVLTLYERGAESGALTYIGDARLATLPAGDRRMLSYAVDQKFRIGRDVESLRLISGGSISDGVFQFLQRERQTTTYRLEAPATEARTVVIDHPRLAGWELVEPDASSARLTDAHYRIEVALEAGEERTLPVTVERPIRADIGIASMAFGDIVRFSSTGELGPALREAFGRLATFRRAVEVPRRHITELENQRLVIHGEQQRIRENLVRVPQGSDLYKRYLRKLDDQEDRLEDIETAIEMAIGERNEATARLRAFINGLKI